MTRQSQPFICQPALKAHEDIKENEKRIRGGVSMEEGAMSVAPSSITACLNCLKHLLHPFRVEELCERNGSRKHAKKAIRFRLISLERRKERLHLR